MDISQFTKMLNDKNAFNYKKLKYKYTDSFGDYIDTLKMLYYSPLRLNDFDGNEIVFLKNHFEVNLKAVKTLLRPQSNSYGIKAVENKIISSAAIENIDFNRDSVRNILKCFAPKDDEENKILGQKLGFDFISKKETKITTANIYKPHMMTVGNFLDNRNTLKAGNYYRDDSVYIVSSKVEHTGLNHHKLNEYMNSLVNFINADDSINELVKSAVIHFYVAYVHLHFDGNGRMARLMHLWYLIQQDYATTLFLPFSSLIVKSKRNTTMHTLL